MPKVSEAHSAARRQQIIDAAYRCFARRGFHQTTMREIYEEAELSPGAVYHYFDGKEAIIRASFEFDQLRSRDVLQAAVTNEDPMQALRGLVDFFFAGMDSAAKLGAGRVNVQGWGEALVDPPLFDAISSVLQDFRLALVQIVRKAQDLERLDSTLDPDSVGLLLLSIYFGMELQKAFDPEIDLDAYKAAVKSMLLAHESNAVDSVESWPISRSELIIEEESN